MITGEHMHIMCEGLCPDVDFEKVVEERVTMVKEALDLEKSKVEEEEEEEEDGEFTTDQAEEQINRFLEATTKNQEEKEKEMVEPATSFKVHTLNFNHNKINHEGMLPLSIILNDYKSIRYLDLSHNLLGDDGVQILCTGLLSNRSLYSLNLSHNCISSKGFQNHILQFLKFQGLEVGKRSHLRKLNLSFNSGISERFARDVIPILGFNRTIHQILLETSNPNRKLEPRTHDAITALTQINIHMLKGKNVREALQKEKMNIIHVFTTEVQHKKQVLKHLRQFHFVDHTQKHISITLRDLALIEKHIDDIAVLVSNSEVNITGEKQIQNTLLELDKQQKKLWRALCKLDSEFMNDDITSHSQRYLIFIQQLLVKDRALQEDTDSILEILQNDVNSRQLVLQTDEPSEYTLTNEEQQEKYASKIEELHRTQLDLRDRWKIINIDDLPLSQDIKDEVTDFKIQVSAHDSLQAFKELQSQYLPDSNANNMEELWMAKEQEYIQRINSLEKELVEFRDKEDEDKMIEKEMNEMLEEQKEEEEDEDIEEYMDKVVEEKKKRFQQIKDSMSQRDVQQDVEKEEFHHENVPKETEEVNEEKPESKESNEKEDPLKQTPDEDELHLTPPPELDISAATEEQSNLDNDGLKLPTDIFDEEETGEEDHLDLDVATPVDDGDELHLTTELDFSVALDQDDDLKLDDEKIDDSFSFGDELHLTTELDFSVALDQDDDLKLDDEKIDDSFSFGDELHLTTEL
eukprot:CAMPEP_0117421336 /NCGR_PEP_ID=MMETSP0758-20121206/2458_1 /TAXON_ID=63605 /ORGANISM="Percolomonas cosmopolitus, Strain AE-1 (ATCC 50343)" /LENGTH=747 /DNA_ID=CAMNT_0005203419 /DNA_START=420 /DNA_END=2659 /DNA_ORIENTATION=-